MGTLTWGHLVLLIAVPVVLIAILSVLHWMRHAGSTLGTPQYARARAARRSALYAMLLSIALLAVGTLSPLWQMSLE